MSAPAPKSVAGAIGIAAALTLFVTLVHLLGELQGWSERLFSTKGGGGGPGIGIWALVPIFGFWFGRRLAANGHRPPSTAKALLLPVAGVGMMAAFFMQAKRLGDDFIALTAIANGLALLAFVAAVAYGWRRGTLVLAAYGYLARIPVIVVQYLAIENGWDVHYAKFHQGSTPQQALVCLTVFQAVLWPLAFTGLIGGFFAALGALTVRRR